ncbi:hypothetical protein L207DRAFT_507713 [Hyaloscypha variabilis F]|uniref:Transposase Tc1-like domain-containing protein n=1 Tax=Hyaloscypha variabilis (strain UAMH 11265 / GT02V1 / F) TaxID=1149755 RepID=A0A2J6S7W5_HYAVF|nr:hypothetical protein L207DRAFT_507713 [Hyaloscypha variabilis F]
MSDGLIFRKSQREIVSNTSIPRRTVRQRRKKAPKPHLISLGIKVSARTIRRELRRVGYQRSKKRLGFALKYRWWGISDYTTFRIWVTRRIDEKRYISYMRSVY